jgi:capsular polysaccharide transport system ATP-binding protein
MIHLKNVTKEYATRHGRVRVLDSVSLRIEPGEKLGILGRNGAGKSTLVRIIGGAEKPSTGQITRKMSVSWPLAFGGGFQGTLTGLDNLRFICRVYGVDYRTRIEQVQAFSELGRYMHEPVKTYSAGMRARLAFAISMAIEFDCFLIDEVIAVGDERFIIKCQEELFERKAAKGKILVSHQPDYLRRYCERGAVLDGGKLVEYPTVDQAIEHYHALATHRPLSAALP